MQLSFETLGKNKKKDPERFTCEVSEKKEEACKMGALASLLYFLGTGKPEKLPNHLLQVTHPLIYQTAACRESPLTHLESLQGFLFSTFQGSSPCCNRRSLWVWEIGVLLRAKKKIKRLDFALMQRRICNLSRNSKDDTKNFCGVLKL